MKEADVIQTTAFRQLLWQSELYDVPHKARKPSRAICGLDERSLTSLSFAAWLIQGQGGVFCHAVAGVDFWVDFVRDAGGGWGHG